MGPVLSPEADYLRRRAVALAAKNCGFTEVTGDNVAVVVDHALQIMTALAHSAICTAALRRQQFLGVLWPEPVDRPPMMDSAPFLGVHRENVERWVAALGLPPSNV